jgi:hypothetical protein
MTDRIKVTPEGREGVWLPDRDSLKAWIEAKHFESVHNFIAVPDGPIIGADHEVDSVLADIDNAERLAVMTGDAKRGNLDHALAIIIDNRLGMYDIGDVTEDDLEVVAGG